MFSSSDILCPDYPERPSVPAVFLLMLALIAVLYVLLYGYISLAFADVLIDAPSSELQSLSLSKLTFEVCADPTKTQSAWLVLAKTKLPSGASTKVWLTTQEELAYGELVQGIARFSTNDESDWGRSNRAKGIAGKVTLVRMKSKSFIDGPLGALARFRAKVLECINPSLDNSRALLAGVLCGYRTASKQTGIDEKFSRVGLSHLMAVSGSHLAVVASLLEIVGKGLGFSPRRRYFTTNIITALYVCLCANPLSAVRSWIMSAIGRAAPLFGRRQSSLNALGVAGIAMCLLDPFCASDLGFQLSVLSVAALALFSGYMEALLALIQLPFACMRALERLPRDLRKRLLHLSSMLRQIIATTLVCQLSTVWLCGYTFGQISLVALLSNVVVAPLFSPLVVVGIFASVLGSIPVLGMFALWAISCVSQIILLLVNLLSLAPFAVVAVSFPVWIQLMPFVLGTCWYCAWPRLNARQLATGLTALICFGAIWFISVAVAVPAQVIVLDVGQGDAILVRQGIHALLIDTGPKGALAEALARNNVFWLDAVVLTHQHDDHTGGLAELEGMVSVNSVLVGEGVREALSEELSQTIQGTSGEPAQELSQGDSIAFSGFTLTCVWPKEATDGQDNEDSLCLLLTYDANKDKLADFKMLLTGDAESDVLAQIVDEVGDIDVLKVGHHGSEVSINQVEANVLKPEVSVASAGEGNSYGHPTPTCINTLESSGSKFLCTIECGDVLIQPSQDAYIVKSQR